MGTGIKWKCGTVPGTQGDCIGSIVDPEVLEYLQTAETELGRMAHIAKQTLGYYREHASAAATSLSQIAADAVRIYEPRCLQSGIAIKTTFESTREIVVRRGEMMQVVSNLIANAVYALSSGGRSPFR
ncbi:hypothetical protein ACFQBQ_16635 [Granulicella cerasi]|uniref:Uncharacterized protein n=1 Tax=Granulicella cerasi TaxID=741063 RepID=A0ABW1ZEN1_9BACT|nr:hypothetical protein [Granulicella cerasi]